MNDARKVSDDHRRRLALVYVRQSSMSQVRENTESLERQYELSRRAVELGWDPTRVTVVDEDLGRSGAESSGREGFKSLVAAVGLGEVGLVLGIEVSRLARNNADWYQLLDLCSFTDTLIADADGLYHPGDHNDRLLLGLKGTMSEAELHLLRGRLLAGLRHKAAKGELRVALPVGYDYDADDKVVLCRDEAEREAVATVFRRFDELGSARQVLLSLLQDHLDLPRHRPKGRVEWSRPSLSSVHNILTHRARARPRRLAGHPSPVFDGTRGVVGSHPGPPPRLRELRGLRGEPHAPASEQGDPIRRRRRRCPGGERAAAGTDPLWALRADDASRLLGCEASAGLGQPRDLLSLRL